MRHQQYTGYLQKELDFLKLLVSRFHEQEKLTGLEVDIALLKAQDIYEQLLKLKLMPESVAIVVEEKPVAKNEEPVLLADEAKVTVAKSLQKETEKKGVEFEIEPVPVKAKAEEVAPVKKETEKKYPPIAVEEQPQAPATIDVQPTSKGAGILAEKIRPATYNPINETIAKKKPVADLSSRLQTTPLTNLASGIGLNDRFLYIRELFQGSSDLYNDTVRQLEIANSLDDALDFINHHFGWDKKDETAQKFIHLVHRRHGNHK